MKRTFEVPDILINSYLIDGGEGLMSELKDKQLLKYETAQSVVDEFGGWNEGQTFTYTDMVYMVEEFFRRVIRLGNLPFEVNYNPHLTVSRV
jgi:hypothetical protein